MSSRPSRWRELSFWFDSLPTPVVPRPPLGGDLDVDVAIVGAGFTGLWTALTLAERDPSVRVAVLEAEVAGFGASGRNGGWCSALFAASPGRLARLHGLGEMHRLRRAMQDTVDEVGRQAGHLGIDCHFRKGGTLHVARSPAQEVRLLSEMSEARSLGIGEDDVMWLAAPDAAALLHASGTRGGLFSPHCAAIHPARLARGLATAAEERGVQLFEQTRVTAIHPGEIAAGRRPSVSSPYGAVRADTVVLATEGYTARLPAHQRDMVPLYSLMVATEPIGDDMAAQVGARDGLTFTDGRHLLVYGQVTVDGRLAFGGRGAPYHFGSRIRPEYDNVPGVHEALSTTIAELFPALAKVGVTHRWGGPLGVHRDWYPSVRFDRSSGIAFAGGYVGDGVATTNLAGRTLADLLLGEESELTSLCWVGHNPPRWEAEPLRYAGINAGLLAMSAADRAEARTGRPSRLAGLLERVTGG